MKKRWFTLIFILIALLTASIAHAWSLGGMTDWVLENAIGAILTAIFMLIAGFAGGTTIGKAILRAKLPIMELKDVVVKVHAARRPSSPGGISMTNEEKEAIWKEVEELINSIVKTFGKGA